MEERDHVFRDQLVGLMTFLNSPESKVRGFRNRIGAIAMGMAKDAGARNWTDLKQRADGPTYDSMLRMFQRESQIAQKAGDDRVMHAFEVLAISLIARRQAQPDLMAGIDMLDKYIEGCESAAKRAGTQLIAAGRPN
jgi:hypothetical protein